MKKLFVSLAVLAVLFAITSLNGADKADAYYGYTYYSLGNGVTGWSQSYGNGFTSYGFNNGVTGWSNTDSYGYTTYSYSNPFSALNSDVYRPMNFYQGY